MSESITNLLQWVVVFAFFLLVIGFIFAEAFWIGKKGWASFGKGFVFSCLSNFIGFAAGLFIFFVVTGIFSMLSLDGTTRQIFDSKIGAPAAIAALIFGFLITPILLVICKRIFLSIMKMQKGKPAWFYALASSVLIFVVSLGVPGAVGYFLFR